MLKVSVTNNSNLKCNYNDAHAAEPETNHEYTTIQFTALCELSYMVPEKNTCGTKIQESSWKYTKIRTVKRIQEINKTSHNVNTVKWP